MVERGIGRGLAAILPTREEGETLHRIPVELIRPNPRQPRSSFDEQGIAGLADSIRAHGLLQPLIVRPLGGDGRYELIAGERRWRAARSAGAESVPAVVRESQDSERLELALIENMAREDLNAVEAAHACAALVEELGVTKEEIGRRVGRSRAAISNLIRLLELPDEVLAMLASRELSEGHGRALLQAPRHHQRLLARHVRDAGLSVRETEAKARSAADGPKPSTTRQTALPPDAEAARREAEDALSSALGVDVSVRLGRRGGRAEIAFADVSELHELARRLQRPLAA